jgi:hypothetical protein
LRLRLEPHIILRLSISWDGMMDAYPEMK